MPTARQIPSHVERVCEPCEFHKMTGAFYGQPDNTWRRYACLHPGAIGPMPKGLTAEQAAKWGALNGRLLEHGRDIGKTENQPEWCPLKKRS
jgi:hypothetical protein